MNRTIDDLASTTHATSTTDSRLEVLKRRKSELDAALRAERDRRKEIERKAEVREIRIVGRALLTAAAQSPDFRGMIKGVLRTTPMSDSDKNFMIARSWL
jgi:hypothetical protein